MSGNGDQGGGGGRWLVVLAVIGVLVAWVVIYKPFRPGSELLPPTAGITNQVPETLTNLTARVRGLTNLAPSNVFNVPPPFSGTNRSSNIPRTTGTETHRMDRLPATTTAMLRPSAAAAPTVPAPPPPPEPAPSGMRHPQNLFEVQLALDRQAISPGSLDGVAGSQTRAAIRAFQKREGLLETGELNEPTRARLWIESPVYENFLVRSSDLARLRPVSSTWLGKSRQDRLDYETLLELAAERGHVHPGYIRRLNPGRDWTNLNVGAAITLPRADRTPPRGRAANVHISLSQKTLQAFDQNGRLMAHFPCSIARYVEKRPLGELTVAVAAENPNYTFNPDIFPESAEARRLGRKLTIHPGPNNPVGVAWIGLDRPGYGIHGTPSPEAVGRTESHGCFRLANWNAEYLVKLVWKGMPVIVER